MTYTETAIPDIATRVAKATTAEMPAPVCGFLLEIGTLTFPVYGDASLGWSIVRGDITDVTPYRYATLDELVFALLNFTVVNSGEA